MINISQNMRERMRIEIEIEIERIQRFWVVE
jgi:hypothetical protein